MNNKTILQIDSSGRKQGSLTRQLSEKITNLLHTEKSNLIKRDLSDGLPFVDEAWIHANFTEPEERTEDQKQTLSQSDSLVSELMKADEIVIGAPLYNFLVPAVLKAWIDMIARARVTFKYTDKGPIGLLKDKKIYIAMASGGVPIGSALDFSSQYLKHVMSFIGITDVTIIDASQSENQLNELFGA
jgi:FMN-dependent NADH-azoreductase